MRNSIIKFHLPFSSFVKARFFRQLAVKKADEEEGEQRVLPHLHLTTWPDKGVPETPDTLNG